MSNYQNKNLFVAPKVRRGMSDGDKLSAILDCLNTFSEQQQREARRLERVSKNAETQGVATVQTVVTGGGSGGGSSGSVEVFAGYQDVVVGETTILFGGSFSGPYDYKIDAWDMSQDPPEKIGCRVYDFTLMGFTVDADLPSRIRYNCTRFR